MRICRKPLLQRLAALSIAGSILFVAGSSLTTGTQPESTVPPESTAAKQLPTVEEARGRARLLHETVHATLQVVHLEYYREEESLKLPAATMKLVFRELAARHQVELRWLAVNAEAMNVEHQPRDAFERKAVEALSSGRDEFEEIAGPTYRFASTITLSSDCLKCHQPNRRSNQSRAAGLVISMPVAQP